jgi:hypothetical protein
MIVLLGKMKLGAEWFAVQMPVKLFLLLFLIGMIVGLSIWVLKMIIRYSKNGMKG